MSDQPYPIGTWIRVYNTSLRNENATTITTIGQVCGYDQDHNDPDVTNVLIVNAHQTRIVPLSYVIGEVTTCLVCANYRLDHPSLPERWQTGRHGLCLSSAQPPHVQHMESTRCAWFSPRDVFATRLYSTKEAARYLGISISNLKYHVHVAGNIKPQKIGNTLVFTQDQLDQFLATRRPQGRPKKQEE